MPSTSWALTACSHPCLTAHVALAGLASGFLCDSVPSWATKLWFGSRGVLCWDILQLASASLWSNQRMTSVMMRLPFSANYQVFFRAQPEDHLFQHHLGCLLKIMIPWSHPVLLNRFLRVGTWNLHFLTGFWVRLMHLEIWGILVSAAVKFFLPIALWSGWRGSVVLLGPFSISHTLED